MPRGGTRHCWSDQHRHRGAGADVSSSYPPAPWMLRSLLGTWGGTLAQQEVGGEKSQPFIVCSQGEVWGRQSAEGGMSSQIQCASQPVASLGAGKNRQKALNGTTKLFHFTFSTCMFSSWRSDERLSKWRSWNIQSWGCVVRIIHYNLHSPLGFPAVLSFMRIVDSLSFTLSYLMYHRSFHICSFMPQNLDWKNHSIW